MQNGVARFWRLSHTHSWGVVDDNGLVAKGYRPVDRDQQYLLPPSMREWLPADDPVWLVIDAVAGLDTKKLHARRSVGGVGRAGYHPDMLLTLLIWGWAQGQRSSRKLERLCHRDITYRIICAGDVPDHVTISRFRAECAEVVEDLFTQVLMLCARVGMVELGVVALDGVKIASNASLGANRTEAGLRKALAAEAARAAAEHADTDADEDTTDGDSGSGDQLPAELAEPSIRAQRIADALAQMPKPAVDPIERARSEVRVRESSYARVATIQQERIDRWYQGRVGRPPKPIDEAVTVVQARARLDAAITRAEQAVAAAASDTGAKLDGPQRNMTDPQSRSMPMRGGGWIQGYNCQAVTSSDGVIIAVEVSNNPSDGAMFVGMSKRAVAAAQVIDAARPEGADANGIGVILADAGYLSEEALTAGGPDRLIATGKSRELNRTARDQPTVGSPPSDATPVEQMAHRLATVEGAALYRQRSHIAETPFGHAKHNLGFRRFTSRGQRRATAEFTFHALTQNLFKALGAGRLVPTAA
ncbi:transposase [Gordonia sp. NB41Y]|uniref:transposase n=1 Tax=Gordonia sp. NB41Y TaxID=875808 RepID=UPI00273A8E51|nr:transposase [Gordonia sp. NB41Y]WLP89160.1 transposase [Gordonia sp. NB41Y]